MTEQQMMVARLPLITEGARSRRSMGMRCRNRLAERKIRQSQMGIWRNKEVGKSISRRLQERRQCCRVTK